MQTWKRPLRPLRQWPARHYVWLILAALLTVLPLLTGVMPVAKAGQTESLAASVAGAEIPLTFNNGFARANGFAEPNQKIEYRFYGTVGTLASIRISSEGSRAQFEVRGRNTGAVYKPMNNSAWDGSLPETQDYIIAVTANQTGVAFTLTVVIDATRILQSGTSQVVAGNVGPSDNARYVFYATAGQSLRVVLTSTTGQARFTLIGVADGSTYSPLTETTVMATMSQDYLLIISSPGATPFTAEITRTSSEPERITFAAGGGTQVRSGNITPDTPRQYVFNAPAGFTVRVLLTSNPAGLANFQLFGLSDGIIYKDLSNPSREFVFVPAFTQDFLVTLVSPAAASFTLEISLSPVTPIVTPITPTPSTTPLPVGCVSDGILNGGFEDNFFWVLGDAPVPPAYVGSPVYSGLRSVRLGIDPAAVPPPVNQESYSSIRQPFQISPMAGSASLSWWHNDHSQEGPLETIPSNIATDRQEVILLNPDLSTAGILYRKRLNGGTWQQSTVDLTTFIGRPLVLYFNVFNDGSNLSTWQFVDQVVMTVCYPPTATPTPTSPATPTPPPTSTPLPTSTPTITNTPVPTDAAMSAAMPPPDGRTGEGEPVVDLLSDNVQMPTSITGAQPGLWFGRTPVEVLTLTGILIGGIAIIIMLAWLIWQYRGPGATS